MISVNVRILKQPETLLASAIVDGATQKRVEFEIVRPDNGWNFRHVIIAGSRDFDRMIDKLWAYGGVIINVREYRGDEPRPEWKEEVVRAALAKVDDGLWEGNLQLQ